VFLMPSVNCLVELTEMPFTVLTLADIEIVNLERVGFNLKAFDMAIVFKDFTKDVSGAGPAQEAGEGRDGAGPARGRAEKPRPGRQPREPPSLCATSACMRLPAPGPLHAHERAPRSPAWPVNAADAACESDHTAVCLPHACPPGRALPQVLRIDAIPAKSLKNIKVGRREGPLG
jgi:hypothetical protein